MCDDGWWVMSAVCCVIGARHSTQLVIDNRQQRGGEGRGMRTADWMGRPR